MLAYCLNCGQEYELKSDNKLSDFQCECGGELAFNNSPNEKSKIPENYKKNIYISYFSIMLLLISGFLKIIVNSTYGTIDGTLAGLIVRITLILGIIIFVYYIFQINKIKDEIINDQSFAYHKMFVLLAFAGLLIILGNITSLWPINFFSFLDFS